MISTLKYLFYFLVENGKQYTFFYLSHNVTSSAAGWRCTSIVNKCIFYFTQIAVSLVVLTSFILFCSESIISIGFRYN